MDTPENREKLAGALQVMQQFLQGLENRDFRVTNFPATQDVKVTNQPEVQKVSVGNWPKPVPPAEEIKISNWPKGIAVTTLAKPDWWKEQDFSELVDALEEVGEKLDALLAASNRAPAAGPQTVTIANLDALRTALAGVGGTKFIGGGGGASSVVLDAVTRPQTPTIAVTALTLADTEYSYSIPAKTRLLMIHLREGDQDLRMSWESGGTANSGNYIVIPAGSTKAIDGIKLIGATPIYLRCVDATAKNVEIETWQ